MRHRLACRKTINAVVDRASEQQAEGIDTAHLLFAQRRLKSVELFVMPCRQPVQPGMHALEREAMRGQHQHILGQAAAKLGDRRQPFGQWIGIGLAVHNRHVRSDARQDLIARDDHAVVNINQARVFGRMPTAGHHLPFAVADFHRCAVIQTVVTARQTRHCAGEITPAAFTHFIQTLFVISV